ncbi:MAG: alpha/beta hydrolase family protein [Pseudomonadota bacterium]
MRPHWRLFSIGCALILAGSLLAHLIQTSNGIEIKDPRFSDSNGRTLSALLYLPPGASAETPAPGVLAVHGYINSREVQSSFAIEMARRGYVVLALDQGGHGASEPPAFAQGFGGPAALRYLRALEFVDADNIGLSGHSMGGWTIQAAAAALPDGYRAMVLQGSSTGSGYAAPGTATHPRNVAVVFSRYDEFAPLMWEVPRGLDVADSEKLQALFGTDTTVVEDRLYGSVEAGTARILHSPPVTHPGTHLSHAAVRHTIDWFDRTLEAGTPAPRTGQIWFLKEIGTLTALAGFIVLLTGSYRVLLRAAPFQPLQSPPVETAWLSRTPRWWALAVLSAIIPVATFYLSFRWGGQLLPASTLLPQAITNQIAFWAVVNAVLLTGLGRLLPATTNPLRHHRILPCLQIALATVGIGYLAVLAADFLFKVDFRFWFVGLRRLTLPQFQSMLVYLVPFTVFFVLILRGLHGGLSVAGDRPWQQYASNALILAGGFTAFLLLQYGSLFARGVLLTPAEPLNTIVMIQFAPLLFMVSVLSTFTYRHSGSHLPGALICALFVSWYIVAGQAMQVG